MRVNFSILLSVIYQIHKTFTSHIGDDIIHVTQVNLALRVNLRVNSVVSVGRTTSYN